MDEFEGLEIVRVKDGQFELVVQAVISRDLVHLDDRLRQQLKDIPPDQANNEFMGMMKVSPAGNRLVFDMVDQYLRDGRLNAYLSDVLMELQRTGTRIDFINTNGDPYIEIDTPEDYEQAKRCFDNVSHG